MTGYETYTAEERYALIERLERDMRYEQSIAEGTGLRAEVAAANVREFKKQIANIKNTK